ncbi:hypothetical protein [Antarctobacter sp.]|uniref:hypothetical protein n=1 Tax=Antarctobacter sp. TaxID=1872577 RepID=UPI002B269EE4|nr:hypothetical protein [Antarctobacter sp.]
MVRWLFAAVALIASAGGLAADAGPLAESDGGLKADFLGRLRALEAPSAPLDMYADEKNADLARIAQQADLFDTARPGYGTDGPPIIALFHGPDCTDCATAMSELERLSLDLSIRAVLLDVAVHENAAMMAALGLDMLPSYVMRDRMIRGHMPAFVLERYITESAD